MSRNQPRRQQSGGYPLSPISAPWSSRSRQFSRDEESAGLLSSRSNRFSAASSTTSFHYYDSKSDVGHSSFVPAAGPNGNLIPAPYDPSGQDFPEPDDALHAPDPPGYRRGIGAVSCWGCTNVLSLIVIVCGIVSLFAAYPVVTFFKSAEWLTLIGDNVAVNGTGQVAILAGMPSLVDPKTPDSAKTRTGYDGQPYKLIFSDEFEIDNRTFYPGDDPFWEAVDIWYGATADLEWYDPGQVTTGDGKLRIKLEMANPPDNHNLTMKSGMLQSWNKFCFSGGGYIEISVQLPGMPTSSGYWPGAWLMGNLGRAGFGASTDGLWPYTYDSCDVGTLPNQTYLDKSGPPAAFNLPPAVDGDTIGRAQFNYELSWLPGQRLSSCTCPGEDHPGPMVGGTRLRGRGSPEIDIIEAEHCKHRGPDAPGCVSQSAQFAPFNALYQYDAAYTTNFWPELNITHANDYKGSGLQQSVSALTDVPLDLYAETQGNYGVFGFEYYADPNDPNNSFITWVSAGRTSHQMTGAAVGSDQASGVGPRLVPGEPMAIILNLAVSNSFQTVNASTMVFPSEFLVDYVRVYQRTNFPDSAVGCDPPDYPTTKYIADHMLAYTNANLSSWEQAGYSFPKSSMIQGC